MKVLIKIRMRSAFSAPSRSNAWRAFKSKKLTHNTHTHRCKGKKNHAFSLSSRAHIILHIFSFSLFLSHSLLFTNFFSVFAIGCDIEGWNQAAVSEKFCLYNALHWLTSCTVSHGQKHTRLSRHIRTCTHYASPYSLTHIGVLVARWPVWSSKIETIFPLLS